MWANLQNADPTKIYYHIHDDTQWLPFVRDSIYPHQWDEDGEEDITNFLKWQKYNESASSHLEVDKSNPEWKKLKLKTIDYMIKGEYLQPF